MRKLLLGLIIIISYSLNAQTGGERKCGSDFASYGLYGMTYNEALDYAGQVHNDYLGFVLSKFAIIKPDFTDTSSLKMFINKESAEFFKSKGFEFDANVQTLKLGIATNGDLGLSQDYYSYQGSRILLQVQDLIKSYDVNNDDIILSKLKVLKKEALLLANDKEVFTVGLPISVAIHSFNYWKLNGQKWLDLFTENKITTDGGHGSFVGIEESVFRGCKVNLWKLGGADVSGAVSGAMGGGIAGPGGALAGGVLVSATSSLGNLSNQVISCYVSWWPF